MSLNPMPGPEQVITWFDWAKIIIPPLITASIALTAAFLAYRFARRGRKEDILYKERYKSFEAIAGYLYEIMRFSDQKVETYSKNPSRNHEILKILEELKKELDILIDNEPNRINLVLLNSKTRSTYYSSVIILENLGKNITNHIIRLKNSNMPAHSDPLISKDIYKVLLELKNEADECQKLAFSDLDLPRK